MKKTFTLFLVLNLFLLSNAKVIYVNQLATGDNNGVSWDDAFTDLQNAFDISEPNDEIWVAKGVYKPTKIFDVNENGILEPREETFNIQNGVQLYGGFMGNETSLGEQDASTNLTILSGDIDNNDFDPDSNGVIDSFNDIVGLNAFHVVTTIGISSGTYISGFVITGGAADSESTDIREPNTNGGGWYNNEQFEKSYLFFSNVSFIGNKAKHHGGAIFFTVPYSTLNSSRLINCNFINNQAHYGGAIYAGSSLLYLGFSLEIDHCLFSSNEAQSGGALHLQGDRSYIISSIFFKNKSSRGGAIYLKSPQSYIYGSSFNQNTASEEGGALGVYSNFQETTELGVSSLDFTNCVFYKNSSQTSGGAIFNKCEEGILQLKNYNSMFYENTAQNNGGAVANFADLLEYNPSIKAELKSNFINCTFSKNIAGENGGAIFNHGLNYLGNDVFTLELLNSILWNDSATENTKEIYSNGFNCISFSLVQNSGGSGNDWDHNLNPDGGYNLEVDPLFVEIMLYGNAYGVSLAPNSPAINKGKNVFEHGQYSSDLLENPRIQQDIVDMGAVEIEGIEQTKAIIYVNQNAVGANNGSSWDDAFTSLSKAFAYANAGDEVWVAKGTYKPSTYVDVNESGGVDPREVSFYLSRSIKLYGGFAGTETALEQRDWNSNLTILSGDIDNNDLDPDSNRVVESVDDIVGQNAYHVLYVNTQDSGMLVDGFIINAGSADFKDQIVEQYPRYSIMPNSCGGGVFYRPINWEQQNFTPHFNNTSFIANLSENLGGGFYVESILMQTGSVKMHIDNCKFLRNMSKNSAGAIFIGEVYPHSRFFSHINKCEFTENESRQKGGAIYMISDFSIFDSTLFIANKVLADNVVNDKFSGSGGAVFLELTNAVFDHCIFEKNAATGSDEKSYAGGGAIFNYSNNGHWANKWGSTPVFKNCYFQKNVAGGQIYAFGGAVNNYSEDAELSTSFINCMFYKNGSQNGGGACANIESRSLFKFSTAYANCSFIANHSGNKGGAIFNKGPYYFNNNYGSYILLENSILWNNTALIGDLEEICSVSYQESDIEEPSPAIININNCLVKKCGGANWNGDIGIDGGNNLDVNPLFQLETTDNGLVKALLTSSSPAINTGNNNAILLIGIEMDIQGNARTFDQYVDMGAFEFQGITTKEKSKFTASSDISIYPIPANEFLIISSQLPEIGSVEIYNLKGQLLIQENILGNQKRIDLKGNNPGLYLVKVLSKDGTELEKRSFVIH